MATYPNGRMTVATARQGGVRVLAVSLPGQAEELASRHGLAPGARKRAAEGLVAAALLSAHIKGEERLTLDLQVSSPPCAGVFEINGDGTVRGRFRPPDVRDQAELFGFLSVAKSLGARELYRGIAKVDAESIEAALQRFLRESQQTDAHVRLAIDLDADGLVEYADGIFVERLPHFPPEEFVALVAGLDADTKRVVDELALGLLVGGTIDRLGEATLTFRCGCSRDRVITMIRGLGAAEISAMIEEQGGAEVTCHFCNEVSRFDAEELAGLRDEAGRADA
ncbi:MAG: Hsp33 family molecular chaperone HslO [Myxococcales bacterium]|nr:Hsp33 family molecular chaperone HslO [Myxococcales bacterium]